jgi:hypothetical protein
VYNIVGQAVQDISSGWRDAGVYTIVWNAQNQPSGVYYAKFLVDEKVMDIKKMILLK